MYGVKFFYLSLTLQNFVTRPVCFVLTSVLSHIRNLHVGDILVLLTWKILVPSAMNPETSNLWSHGSYRDFYLFTSLRTIYLIVIFSRGLWPILVVYWLCKLITQHLNIQETTRLRPNGSEPFRWPTDRESSLT